MAETRLVISANLRSVLSYEELLAQDLYGTDFMTLCRMLEMHNTINGWQKPSVPCASSLSHLMQS